MFQVWRAVMHHDAAALRKVLPRKRSEELHDAASLRYRGESLIHVAVRACGYGAKRGGSEKRQSKTKSKMETAKHRALRKKRAQMLVDRQHNKEDQCIEVILILINRGVDVGAKRAMFADEDTALHVSAPTISEPATLLQVPACTAVSLSHTASSCVVVVVVVVVVVESLCMCSDGGGARASVRG